MTFRDACSVFRQVLYARDVDQRSTTFEKAIEMGKEYKKRTKVGAARAYLMC